MTISKDLGAAYVRIFIVEAAYWVISIGMVFVNRTVLSDTVLTDDLTVFITTFQILLSLIILTTLNYITKHYLEPAATSQHSTNKNEISINDKDPLLVDENDDEDVLFVNDKITRNYEFQGNKTDTSDQRLIAPFANSTTNSPKLEHRKASKSISEQSDKSSQESLKQLFIVNIPHRINLETCKIVFPLSILYIGMLLLNNFCLKNVGVAFYFVCRSLTTVFNVIFTYFLINEPVSRGALVCCGFIVLGFILGVDQENVFGSLSVIGVLFGVASSLFTSIFTIYTKKTLAKLDRNIWVLVLYNNINAILLCTPLLIIHGDVHALISDKVVDPFFWLLLSISGVMAFFISIVTNASIKYTSPLTHNISGTAKACFQTVIAVIYEKEHKSYLWWTSNITILVASAMYSRIKQLEMERRTSTDLANQQNLINRRNKNITNDSSDETIRFENGHQGAEDRRDSSSSEYSITAKYTSEPFSDKQPIVKTS